MSLWRRLWGAQAPSIETRTQDRSWDVLAAVAGPQTAVSGRLAENLSTVLACINAISTAIASLPAEVQRRTGARGYDTDETHPLAILIRDGPNPSQSWPDFVEWWVASTLLTGNGLTEVVRDETGAVRQLVPHMWGHVVVQQTARGRIVFDVSDQSSILGTLGGQRRLLDSDVSWLRDRTDDGIVGRSRLSRAAGTLAPALRLQEFTESMWQNGVNPSGSIELDGELTHEQRRALADNITGGLTGPQGAAKVIVLDRGLKWKSISVSPDDAELLDSRRFTVEELARIYNVPPPIAGDLSHGSFANVEHLIRWFAQSTLSPWVTKLEHEVHRSVFSAADRRTHRLHLDLEGLQRGDPETRWTSHGIAIDKGILTVDEIRALEGWGPRGDMGTTTNDIRN